MNQKKMQIVIGLMATIFLPMMANAADVSITGVTWNTTGNAGLIASNYNTNANDAPLGASATGNGMYGFVSTYHDYQQYFENPNAPMINPSPLVLNDTEGGFNQTNGSMVQSSSFSASANSHLTLYFNYVSTDGRGYEDYAWARLVSTATNDTAAWLYTARSGNAPDNNGTSDYVPGKVLKDQVGFDSLDNKDPNRQIAATLNDGQPVIGINGNTQWAPLGDSAGQCWDVGTSCGYTGWVKSDYVVNTDGDYYLEIGVSNWGDTAFQTALAFDFVGLQQPNFADIPVLENIAPVPEPETYGMMLMGLGFMGFVTLRRKNLQA